MARPTQEDGEADTGRGPVYPPPGAQQPATAPPPAAYPPPMSSSPHVNPAQAAYPPGQPEPAPYPPPSPYPPPEQYPPREAQYDAQPVVIGMPWYSGLFDCHEHQTNAIMTAFFPCVTFGQIAEILDAGETTCAMGSLMYLLMGLCLGPSYRTKLRTRYNLVMAPAEDWVVHLFCPMCALCQEFRELKSRGIDPALGYLGNLAKQQQQQAATTVPPPPQFMNP